jgi:hypothetical protein
MEVAVVIAHVRTKTMFISHTTTITTTIIITTMIRITIDFAVALH